MNMVQRILNKKVSHEYIPLSSHGLDVLKISKYDNKFTRRI